MFPQRSGGLLGIGSSDSLPSPLLFLAPYYGPGICYFCRGMARMTLPSSISLRVNVIPSGDGDLKYSGKAGYSEITGEKEELE